MQKLLKKVLKNQTPIILIVLFILIIPTFWRMLKPGIFSMHDFHEFRLLEYHKCIQDLQIPCRWSPDAALGYGQPLFNFYGQLPFAYGEIFHLFGFSILDSVKIAFASSFILAGFAMFFLSRQLWGNNLAGLLSALVYTYAPYRAVDVWVRGALPEAFAFIFFPLIIYFFNDFVLNKKNKSLILFSVFFASLILTHNLSALMFSVFLLVWGVYFLTKEKAWRILPKFIPSGILIFGLSAFYILPLVVESKLTTITQVTSGYYDFRLHFNTLSQMLISRFWGYGGSFWGDKDDLSLSVGHLQWILPLLAALFILVKSNWRKNLNFFVLLGIGWFYLFLTHNKSIFLWEAIPPLQFVQFPWRFLGSAEFAFALSSGLVITFIKKENYRIIFFSVAISILIILNFNFFFEDLWYKMSDKIYFSGLKYEYLTTSGIKDYYPKYGKTFPTHLAPQNPIIIQGVGSAKLIEKKSNNASYFMDIKSAKAEIQIPIVYFPGWEATSLKGQVEIYPSGDLGLITAKVSPLDQEFKLIFRDTPIRFVGNVVSFLSIILVLGWLLKTSKKK